MSGLTGTGFIPLDLAVDPEDVFSESADYMQSVIPGWDPASGNLDTHILEAAARPSAEAREAAQETAQEIFHDFGQLVNELPITEASASVTSTWTMKDTAGYRIPDGTQVVIPVSGSDAVAFVVDGEVEVAEDSATTEVGEVLLVAVEPGEDANNLSGTPQLVDALAFVESITLVGTTGGGVDAEDPVVYRDRLAETLQLLSPTFVLAEDAAILAQRVAGVHRAVAIDNYNPADPETPTALMIGIAAIDEAGASVGGSTKAQIETMLEDLREQNAVVNVIDPTTTLIDAQTEIVALAGFDTAAVQADVEAALSLYLSPAEWGQPITGDQRGWVDQLVVRLYEVAAVIDRVAGVDYIVSLGLRLANQDPEDAYAAADIALAGPAALVQLDTIDVTVNAP